MDHGLRCSPAENDSFIHSLHLAGFPAHRRCNDEIVGREGGRLMAERIYARAGKGGLEPLEEEPFSNEDELQALIAEHPELLDGKQIRPDDPRRWVLVTREKGIAETADAGARWAIDHLIVDQDSVPTLAEVKRGSNPEIRRTVVGQMLRVIGRTTGHASPRGKLTRESFLEALPTKTAREVADRLLAVAEQQGASLIWGSGSVSVRVHVEDKHAPHWRRSPGSLCLGARCGVVARLTSRSPRASHLTMTLPHSTSTCWKIDWPRLCPS
jgi:hypothetical protein